MNRQLMWIHGLIDQKFNEYLKALCLEKALALGLSDRFFKIPLHISLKRSFYIYDFNQIKKDVFNFLDDYSIIECVNPEPIIINNRLWLKVESEELFKIHHDLDEFLLENHSIIIDEFDRNYYPHISLFHSDDVDKLNNIYKLLLDNLSIKSFFIDKVTIGVDGNIEKYELKK